MPVDSFVGSLMAAFGPGMDYSAPDGARAVAEFRQLRESRLRRAVQRQSRDSVMEEDDSRGLDYGSDDDDADSGALYQWESDAVVTALQTSAVFKCVTREHEAGGSLLSSDRFLTDVLHGGAVGSTSVSGVSGTAHARERHTSKAQQRGPSSSTTDHATATLGEGTHMALSALSAKTHAECRQHVRELCALRCILQRPPSAFTLVGTYDMLLARLTSERAGLVAYLVNHMHQVWSEGVRRAKGETLNFLVQLLCLYAEVLFYLSLHANVSQSQPTAESTTGEANGPTTQTKNQATKETVRSGTTTDSTADDFISRTVSSDSGLKGRLLALIVQMSGEVLNRQVPNMLQPRRCAVLLTSLCVDRINAFDDEALRIAAATTRGKCNLFDFCLAASLPRHAQTAMTATKDTGALHRSRGKKGRQAVVSEASNPQAQLILGTMCRTTIYDADIVTLFRDEGNGARLLRDMASVSIGAALERALAELSVHVWRHFSKDALMSVSKGMSLYAWSWRQTPACLGAMLQFIDEGLRDAFAGLQKAEDAREQARNALLANGGLGEGDMLTGGGTRGPDGANLSALLAGAVGYGVGSAYDNTDEAALSPGLPSVLVTAAQEQSTSLVEEKPDAFCFTNPNEQVLYLLSLYAYTLASMSWSSDEFNEVASNLFWRLPRGDAHALMTVGQTQYDRRIASLFPMSAVFASDEKGAQINLLHQLFGYLSVLVRSPDLARVLSTAPESFACATKDPQRSSNGVSPLGPDQSKMDTSATVSNGASSQQLMSALVTAFHESTLTLLYHLFTCFPHELSHMSQVTGQNVLDLFVSIAMASLQSPDYTNAYTARLIRDLLRRFNTAVENPEGPASLLLQRELLHRLGAQQPIPAAIAFDELTLFVRLYAADETERILPSRALLSLVYVEPGVLSGTLEGVSYFSLYTQQIFELLMLDVPNVGMANVSSPLPLDVDRSLEAQEDHNRSSDAGTATGEHEGRAAGNTHTTSLGDQDDSGVALHVELLKAVRNTYRLLPVVAPELVTALIARLADGIVGLLSLLDEGLTVVGGRTVAHVLEMSLLLLAEVIRLTGYTTLAASLVLPAVPGFNDGHPVPLSYVLLAAVYFVEDVPAQVMTTSAQILCASVAVEGVSLFPALRSHLSNTLRYSLASTLHQSIKSHVGSQGNVVRLELLRVLSEKDLTTVQHFTGPDSLPGNREAVEITDLIIAKVLSGVVLTTGAVRPAEKASALRVLVQLGLTGAISVSRIWTLITETARTLAKRDTPVYALVDLVAAAASFANAVMVEQANARQYDWLHPANRSEPPTPRLSTSTGRGRAASNVTPLLLGSPGGASSGGGGGLGGMSSEAVDAVLRKGSECLLAATAVFEQLCAVDTFLYPDTSVQLSREAAFAVQEEASVLALGGSLPVATAATGNVSLGKLSLVPMASPALDTFHTRSSMVRSGKSLRGQTTMSRLITRTASARAHRTSVYHTDALPDVIAEVSAQQENLFPLALGDLYRYHPLNRADADEVVTSQYNVLTSVLAAVEHLSLAMESSLWLSSGEGERSALFVNRSHAVLHAAIRCSLIAKPNAPALAPALWASVQRSLSLAGAAALAIASASGVPLLRDISLGGTPGGGPSGAGVGPSSGVGGDGDVVTDTRRDLRHLVAFMSANRDELLIVNACFSILTPLSSLTQELGASEEVYRLALRSLQSLKETPQTDEAVSEELHFVMHLRTFIETAETDTCPLDVLAFLLPALFRRARLISNAIVATAAASPLSTYFCECLQCIRSAILHAPDVQAAAAFLPVETVVALADALGVFSCSQAASEGTGQVHQRQAWHVAWCAVLELFIAVLAGGAATRQLAAKENPWLAAVGKVFPQIPRFLLALGAFTDVPEDSRVYYFWDVEEMSLCTELVAIVAALGFPLPSLLPTMQRGFLHTHHFRLVRSCVASNALADTATREARQVETMLVHTARHQLSFFLAQATQGVPLSLSHGQNGVAVLRLQREVTPEESTSTVTFELLRRFIAQELRAIRHAGLEAYSSGTSTSGRSSEGAAPPTPLRETSMPPTPSRPRDYDTVTEDATTTLADALTSKAVADHRALHIDLVQLSLALFTSAAESIARETEQSTGQVLSTASLRDLRINADKLLHVLDTVSRDLKKMDSPKLSAMVTVMRERLKTVVHALQ